MRALHFITFVIAVSVQTEASANAAQVDKPANEKPIVVGPLPHGSPGTIREVDTPEDRLRRCELKAHTKFNACIKQKGKDCFMPFVQETAGCCKVAGVTLPKGTGCTTYMKEKGILKSLPK